MKTILNENLKTVTEEVEVLRFSIDLESKKINIQGINKKYNLNNNLINSEFVSLVFRGDDKFNEARKFILCDNSLENMLQLLIKKLEIDRHLEDGVLCDALPPNCPPYKGN